MGRNNPDHRWVSSCSARQQLLTGGNTKLWLGDIPHSESHQTVTQNRVPVSKPSPCRRVGRSVRSHSCRAARTATRALIPCLPPASALCTELGQPLLERPERWRLGHDGARRPDRLLVSRPRAFPPPGFGLRQKQPRPSPTPGTGLSPATVTLKLQIV